MNARTSMLPVGKPNAAAILRKQITAQIVGFLKDAIASMPPSELFEEVEFCGRRVSTLAAHVTAAGYTFETRSLNDLAATVIPTSSGLAGTIVVEGMSGRGESERRDLLSTMARRLSAGGLLVIVDDVAGGNGGWSLSDWLRELNRAFGCGVVAVDIRRLELTSDAGRQMFGLAVRSLGRVGSPS